MTCDFCSTWLSDSCALKVCTLKRIVWDKGWKAKLKTWKIWSFRIAADFPRIPVKVSFCQLKLHWFNNPELKQESSLKDPGVHVKNNINIVRPSILVYMYCTQHCSYSHNVYRHILRVCVCVWWHAGDESMWCSCVIYLLINVLALRWLFFMCPFRMCNPLYSNIAIILPSTPPHHPKN